MKIIALAVFFVAFGCSTPKKKVYPAKAVKSPVAVTKEEDAKLKELINLKFSHKGKFSSVSDGDVTTEKYRRDDGETVLTLEKGELRTETLTEKGRKITRTWQDGDLTNLTVAYPKKTTMVTFDADGNFTQKIMTEKGKKKAVCVWYEGESTVRVEDDTCVETLSGLD
jgi:outer membrane protein assembly factor BamE (lipoprotein component of BamABCDE complex)